MSSCKATNAKAHFQKYGFVVDSDGPPIGTTDHIKAPGTYSAAEQAVMAQRLIGEGWAVYKPGSAVPGLVAAAREWVRKADAAENVDWVDGRFALMEARDAALQATFTEARKLAGEGER